MLKLALLAAAIVACVNADESAKAGAVVAGAAESPFTPRLAELGTELAAVKEEVVAAHHDEEQQLKHMREKARLRAEAAAERAKAIQARLEALAKAGREARLERERAGKAAAGRAREMRAGVDKLRGHVSAVGK